MYTLRLFTKIVKYRFLVLIEYPGAFFAGIAAQWASYGIQIALLFLVVWRFGSLAGWLPAEVVFLYAVWLLTYALGASFTFNLANAFPQMALNGTLDEALIKPVAPMAFLLASNYNLGYISHVTLTTAALAFSIVRLGVAWSVMEWLWLVMLVVAGAVIQGCLMLICEMPSLRTRSASPTGVFFWELRDFTQYPLNIYPKALQFIFTAVLPFGFVNYYPLQVLLQKNEGILPGITKWLSPVIAIILLGVTALCWRVVTRRYESAGT